MTSFPLKCCGLARSMAASMAEPLVARTMISPKAAESEKVPVDAFLPTSLTHVFSLSLFGVREAIFTSCWRLTNPFPKALPTSPLPRMPTFMISSSVRADCVLVLMSKCCVLVANQSFHYLRVLLVNNNLPARDRNERILRHQKSQMGPREAV